MDKSVNILATELPSSIPAPEQSIADSGQQHVAVHDTHCQLRHLKIEDQASETWGGIMEDDQSRVIYHVEADSEGEAEDIHVTRQPNNTIDFSAGVQHSEVNWASSDSENDGEIQESDNGDKVPMQCNNNNGGAFEGDETTNNNPHPINAAQVSGEASRNLISLATPATDFPFYTDVHDDERGIFVDFDPNTDVEDEEAVLVHQEDNEIVKDVGYGSGAIEAFASYPETTEIISDHLFMPSQQAFTSLNHLLSSKNAPGRGLYKVEKVLEHEEGREAELEEKMKYIAAELDEVKARKDRAHEIIQTARTNFSEACGQVGIYDNLWKEYEAFCESLEPKFGNRGGWSVTCFKNHGGSYLTWDPELDLFKESVEMPWGNCNFRCEATTVQHKGNTEYVVEFWPLPNPEPRVETARTWRHQYPNLYSLAEQAASHTFYGNSVAKELLRSLPNPNLPFSGGWLFEYAPENARAQHPTLSRRWSYRNACRVPIDGQQDQEDDTVLPETEPTARQGEEMEPESDGELVDSKDSEIWSDGDGDVKMEDLD